MKDKPLPRALERQLTAALKSAPVTVVTGARQTGKSTLVRSAKATRGRRYLTLDDLAVLERAQREPDALIRGATRLTLDEVQRAPELLLAVKRAVDERRSPGRFVITASADLTLMRSVSETLAGRAVHLRLWPLTRREQLGMGRTGVWSELFANRDRDWPDLLESQKAPREGWSDLAQRGGYPTPAHEFQGEDERALWFAGYTQSYLERDVRGLTNVASLVDFRRLMRAACLRIGNLVNQAELARDVGLSPASAHRHLDLLEISYQLVRLPAYSVNRTKRLIKTPKVYWSDTGLALHLSGETVPRGAHLENLILADLVAWRALQLDVPEVLYYRTAPGEEVDFVIEWKQKLLPIEVKTSQKPRLDDAKSIRAFRAEYPERSRSGLVLYDGTETTWLADGILATPWWRVV